MTMIHKMLLAMLLPVTVAAQTSTIPSTLPPGMTSFREGQTYVPAQKLTVWFDTDQWPQNGPVGNYGCDYTSTFVLGNGRLGMAAMGTTSEGVLINDKTYYDGVLDPDNLATSDPLGNYQPLGYLRYDYKGENRYDTQGILRQLDLTKAVASMSRNRDLDGYSVSHARQYLVSYNYNVGVIYFSTSGAEKIDYDFTLLSPRGDALAGQCDGEYITVTGRNKPTSPLKYNVTARIIPTGGTVTVTDQCMSVRDADAILVIVGASTDYDINTSTCVSGESDEELAARVRQTVDRASALTWQELYDDHLAEYVPQFDTYAFDLPDAVNDLPTDGLRDHYDAMGVSDTAARSDSRTRMVDMLLAQMGRYLTLASSRGPLPVPSNLQGLWANADPAWSCDFHANINVQMNYWPCENTNISHTHMPFLSFLKTMAAKKWTGYADALVPGTGGWTHHFAFNQFGACNRYNGSYTEAAAWNCTHIYNHYLYTGDRDFLREYFPTLYGACRFFMGFMVKDSDGRYVVPNRYSPEQGFGNGQGYAVHAQQLVHKLLSDTYSAALALGKNLPIKADLKELKHYLDNMDTGIYPMNGALCEWKNIAPNLNDHHRHLSHLMCLYPLGTVSPYDADTTAYRAACNSLKIRGDRDGGENAAWNTAWKMNAYARALEGDLALRQLAYGIGKRFAPDLRSMTKSSFQIEGDAGVSAAIAEMLLQSYRSTVASDGTIHAVLDILPALPGSWPEGSVRGLKAVGDITVDIIWASGKPTSVTVHNPRKVKLTVNGVEEGIVKMM